MVSNKNYGLDIAREEAEQDGTEYLAGRLTCIAEIPLAEREKYFPAGEVQRGAEDTMSCASNAPMNILEAKLNYLITDGYWEGRNGKALISQENRNWLFDNGYAKTDGGTNIGVELSDAFIAIKSKTTRRGNSMKAPLQAMHEHGVIPKVMLPLGPDMTFDQFHNPDRITKEMEDLGKEFLKRIPISYGKEYKFREFLAKDMLCVGGYAYPAPVQGIYPRVEYPANHEFVLWKPEYFNFDSYIDDVDGDFIKELAPDFKFIKYGYRLAISEKNLGDVRPNRNWFVEILQTLWEFIKDIRPR